MAEIRYDVRVLTKDGKLVTKRQFKTFRLAANFIKDKLIARRRVTLTRREIAEKFTIVKPWAWGVSEHDPYQLAPGPLRQTFLHTSVTKQLPESAKPEQEKEQMRVLDGIAKSRGFNGISYSFCVFPSGRAYEGRGWLVVEAATEGLNEESDSICFAGNTDAFKATGAQLETVRRIIEVGQSQGKLVKTGLDVRAHREVAPKACPGKFVTDAMIQSLQQRVNQ